jgi:hypothetical protein
VGGRTYHTWRKKTPFLAPIVSKIEIQSKTRECGFARLPHKKKASSFAAPKFEKKTKPIQEK